jgi:4-methoxybenzoate monooxygenase (O-demethylating)
MSDVLEATVPSFDLDPFGDAFLSDPYRHQSMMREAAAVVRLPRYDLLALTRFSEVRSVLLDWRTYCSSAGVGLANFRKETPWRPPSVLLEADPPLHDRTRGILMRILTPKLLRSLQDTFTREAEEFVARLVRRGHVDAVADLAEPYPVKVFSDALGLPVDGRHHLLAYSNLGFNAFGPRNRRFQDAMDKATDAVDWVMANCRREAFAPGGFGALIYAAADTGELSEEEAFLIVRGFLTAGMDTTVSAIGSAILCLARNPDQWALLRADPALARAAFEETVRLEAPIQTFFRTTTKPVEIAGVAIDEGQKLMLSLAAANRDPRQWDEPERFNIARRLAGHVGFGAGIHVCVGQMIARMEGEAVLGALARQVKSIELTEAPQYRLNNTMRSLSALPVVLHAQA